MKYFSLVLSTLACAASAAYNSNKAEINAWLSAAAYCEKKDYPTREFQGPTSGFVYTSTISNVDGTQGYIGYLPSEETIYVAYRGSSNIRNWVTNLQFTQIDYASQPGCKKNLAKA